MDSEIFSWHIWRGTLTSQSAHFLCKCASELKSTSMLRDDFLRNSWNKCVLEFILRELLDVFFFRRTWKFYFCFQIQE